MTRTAVAVLPDLPRGAETLAYLTASLTPARLQHSLEVMQVMGDLAEIYCLDREQARMCGLAHDCAKDLPDETLSALAVQAGINISNACERHPLYLHGPVGAWVAQHEMGIPDPAVLSAIATHTLLDNGGDFHAPLSWCLRFADILAPSRSWKDVIARLRPVVYAGQMRRAAALHINWICLLYPEIGIPVHPHILALHQELLPYL